MQDQILAVQRMQDYINEHLNEKITPADLSLASRFSPWYSRKLFTECTGLTPAQYIRRLRLSKSALRLRDESCLVLDAAMDAGFDSVDGYQRAFLKEFGCNPREYAKNPVPLYLFKPYGVKYKYIKDDEEMKEVKNIFIQLIEKPERKVIIKRGIKATNYFEYCEEVGCDIWGLLMSIKSVSGEPICMWLPKKLITPGTSEYVQGAEVEPDFIGNIPKDFDIIDLPAAKYLMFRGEPFAEEDYGKAIEEVWQAEKKYDPALIGFEWDADNPKIQLEPIGSRGYIELVPIKQKSTRSTG